MSTERQHSTSVVPTGASVATPGRDVYGFCGSVADRGDPVCGLARCGGVNYPRVPQETARPSLGFHLGTPRGPLVVGKEHLHAAPFDGGVRSTSCQRFLSGGRRRFHRTHLRFYFSHRSKPYSRKLREPFPHQRG